MFLASHVMVMLPCLPACTANRILPTASSCLCLIKLMTSRRLHSLAT